MTDNLRWMNGAVYSIVVVCMQYFVTTRIKDGLRLEVLPQAVFVCLAVTVIPLLSQSFAARLPAMLFQQRDVHGATCVRLIASSDAVPNDWEGISDGGPTLESRDLDYVAQMDGCQAKVTVTEPTTTIPAKQVQRIGSCKARATDKDAAD